MSQVLQRMMANAELDFYDEAPEAPNGHRRQIVVGVDGTSGCIEAIRWAAKEAVIRGAELVAVKVWSSSELELGFVPDDVLNSRNKLEEAELARDIEEAVGDNPPIPIRMVVRTGPVTKNLYSTAEEADLLVLGSKRRRGLSDMVVRSVSTQVSHHAPCPVVIVPQGWEPKEDLA